MPKYSPIFCSCALSKNKKKCCTNFSTNTFCSISFPQKWKAANVKVKANYPPSWFSVGICELLDFELPLLLLLLWLLIDGFECNFLGLLWCDDEDEDVEDAARKSAAPFLTPLLFVWCFRDLPFFRSVADSDGLVNDLCRGVDLDWGWPTGKG